jgi:hypothetical protein
MNIAVTSVRMYPNKVWNFFNSWKTYRYVGEKVQAGAGAAPKKIHSNIKCFCVKGIVPRDDVSSETIGVQFRSKQSAAYLSDT